MHYYRKNIGDYNKRAGRLSLLQNGVYERLRDACLEREQFPTKAEAIDWVWASTAMEIEAVEFILARFFTVDQDGIYTDFVIMEMMQTYWEFCKKQGLRGGQGGRPKGSTKKPDGNSKKPNGLSVKPSGNPAETQRKPNKPLTTNHYPLTNTKDPTVETVVDPLAMKDMELAGWIWKGVQRVAPKQKQPNLESWADTIRLMRERDGHTHREIADVFKWSNNHQGERFSWSTNILSVKTLREKFGKLDAEMRRHNDEKSRGHSEQRKESTVSRASRIATEHGRRLQAQLDALGTGDDTTLDENE